MAYRVTFLTVLPAPYQQELFAALQASGQFEIKVYYYTSGAPDRGWQDRRLQDFEQILPGKTLSWLGPSAHLNPSIVSVLRQNPADLFVISDYSAPSAQIAMRYLVQAGRPWVFWGERPGIKDRGRLGVLIRRQLQRPIMEGATAIAAIGEQAVQLYRELTASCIPVVNIPYYCDLASYRTAYQRRLNRKERSKICVLFSGQLIPRKGPDLLIDAFLRIADHVPHMHLSLMGDGPERQSLAARVPQRLANRVTFFGFLQPDAMAPVYEDADIFVLPSRHDGWGIVVNEAVGAGLPIIVSDRVGAGHDLVKHNVNGYICPSEDIDALAAALTALGTSETLRRGFSQASATLSEAWNLSNGVERWAELCDRLLSPGVAA